MSDWLNGVRDALDSSLHRVKIFFRDDDAGWSNDRLYLLLDEFAKVRVPIDLAIIPSALEQSLAGELLKRRQQNQQFLGLHQHGYRHINHEPVGRKCEFGISRTKAQQGNDIESGQRQMQALLGDAVDPFFTPPWNRCAQDTVYCLEELGFKLLSRDLTAHELKTMHLQQVPVHIDWCKFFKTSAYALTGLAQAIATSFKQNRFTGIMLHHADMEAGQLKPLAELLAVIATHDNAQGILLRHTLS